MVTPFSTFMTQMEISSKYTGKIKIITIFLLKNLLIMQNSFIAIYFHCIYSFTICCTFRSCKIIIGIFTIVKKEAWIIDLLGFIVLPLWGYFIIFMWKRKNWYDKLRICSLFFCGKKINGLVHLFSESLKSDCADSNRECMIIPTALKI